PVRVQQRDLARAVCQGGFHDRHHRGDPTAAREQQQVVIQRLWREDTRGRQNLHFAARGEVVTDPVRRVTVLGPFDGDLWAAVGVGRTRQRVATCDRAAPVTGYPDREELSRPVVELLCLLGGRLEHHRAGVAR